MTTIAQPTSLAALKRACGLGQRIRIVNHVFPNLSRVTKVTHTQGNALVTRARNPRGEVVEKCYYEWPPASQWSFGPDGATVTRDADWNDPGPFMTITILPADAPLDPDLRNR